MLALHTIPFLSQINSIYAKLEIIQEYLLWGIDLHSYLKPIYSLLSKNRHPCSWR